MQRILFSAVFPLALAVGGPPRSKRTVTGLITDVLSPISLHGVNDATTLASAALQFIFPESCISQLPSQLIAPKDQDDYPFTPKCTSSAVESFTCFPKGSLVRKQEMWVPIESLEEGMEVADGDGGYTRVIGWLHKRPNHGEEIWIEAEVENGATIKATPGHIVFVRDPLGEGEMSIPMKDLNKGHLVKVWNGEWLSIRNLKVIRDHLGLYAPLTETGTLLVDGVKMSSFSVLPLRIEKWIGPIFGGNAEASTQLHELIRDRRGGSWMIHGMGWKFWKSAVHVFTN